MLDNISRLINIDLIWRPIIENNGIYYVIYLNETKRNANTMRKISESLKEGKNIKLELTEDRKHAWITNPKTKRKSKVSIQQEEVFDGPLTPPVRMKTIPLIKNIPGWTNNTTS